VPNGENKYHAIFGANPAYFVSASSLGPALAALGAHVKIASPSGARTVAVEKFFLIPQTENDREIDLHPNEIVTEIVIPAAPMKNATYEIREKQALDWPLATASVALKMSGSKVAGARIVMGHVAPIPWTATAAEHSLTGKAIDEASAQAAAEAAVEGAQPLSQNGYKVQLAKVAVKRALLAAAGKA
jgi:xanthine dehydrogenase YagS FAD-binding subunit